MSGVLWLMKPEYEALIPQAVARLEQSFPDELTVAFVPLLLKWMEQQGLAGGPRSQHEFIRVVTRKYREKRLLRKLIGAPRSP